MMRKNNIWGLFLGTLMVAGSAQAVDLGVSINVGQPGFYGRIDIGNTRPEVVVNTPVWIQQGSYRPAPVYLRVPPGHQKKWSKHCREYRACDVPVFFVRDDWYERVYVPTYRQNHGGRDGDDRRGWQDREGDDHPGKGHKDKGHKDKGHGKGRD